MNPNRVLQLARYQGTRAVDLGNSAAADHQEATEMTVTAVDLTAALGRLEAAEACGVSIDTIKRRLKAGSFPNARQVGLNRTWVIPGLDLVASGLLPAEALALPAAPLTAAASRSHALARLSEEPLATSRLVDALAEDRGLRAELDRAEREIAFLRGLVMDGRAA